LYEINNYEFIRELLAHKYVYINMYNLIYFLNKKVNGTWTLAA